MSRVADVCPTPDLGGIGGPEDARLIGLHGTNCIRRWDRCDDNIGAWARVGIGEGYSPRVVCDLTASLSGVGAARHGEGDGGIGQTTAAPIEKRRGLGDWLPNAQGGRGWAEHQGGGLDALCANVPPLDRFIMLRTA